MSTPLHRASGWVYGGFWGVIARLFLVPAAAPSIPTQSGDVVEQLRPAAGFLRCIKFKFWCVLLLVFVPLMIGVIATIIESPTGGVILLICSLALTLLTAMVAYTAIHLRYDTMWYVLTDRSVRIRRGIWMIAETTITYENIQNVVVSQGPVQRFFGIADVIIQTAGGGGGGAGKDGGGHAGMHVGMIEGIADAPRIRDLFLARLSAARGAGLGDDHHAAPVGPSSHWTTDQIDALRQIRDTCRQLQTT